MHPIDPIWTQVLFLLFVAIAVYVQTLTGFAVALILLGLVGATDLLPLVETVNVATVISFVNAATFLYRRRPLHLERALVPTVVTCVLGIVAGTVLLTWLAGSAYEVLRLLLGAIIILSALVLWRAGEPLETVSSPATFAVTGGLAGLMGGMFSAPGPPLVFLLYRQPMPFARIQESLLLLFGVATGLRLVIVLAAGQFSWLSLRLTAEAVPVVILVTALVAGRPLPVSPRLLRSLASLLLIVAGVGLIATALTAM